MYLPIFTTHTLETVIDEGFEHQKVCEYILKWVEEFFCKLTINETHARILWQKLETFYASKTGSNSCSC